MNTTMKFMKPSNIKVNTPSKYRHQLDSYFKDLSTPRNNAIIEKAGFKVAEKFGFKESDFTDDDVRSYYDPDKLFEQLDNFADFPGEPLRCNSFMLDKALRWSFKQLGITKKSLKLLKLDNNLIKHLDQSKHAGFPSMQTKGGAFFDSLERAKSVLSGEKDYFHPAIPTARTQRKRKTRLAWVMPLDSILVEHTVYQPVINNLGYDNPLLTKMSSSRIASKLYEKDLMYKTKVGIDYSQFDARVPEFLIHKVFDMLKNLFHYDTESEKRTLDRTFEVLRRNFIYTVILMPNGRTYQKRRGIPSGSQLTSIIGSLCNLTMWNYYKVKNDILAETFVLGDDSATFTNEKVDFHDFAKTMEKSFGMKVSVDKCSIRKEGVEVLGYVYRKGLRLEDNRKTLAKLIFPETSRKVVEHYSKFLKNLILDYSLTNANLSTGLSNALLSRQMYYTVLEAHGSLYDQTYVAKQSSFAQRRDLSGIGNSRSNVLRSALS